jgi:RNA polymerase sigma factor (TIGR02999 family)
MAATPRAAGPSDPWLAIYDELRRVAAYYLSAERIGHTLQPTALVHQAFLRLSASNELDLSNRSEVLAAASVTMRRILIDHARSASTRRKRRTEHLVAIDERAPEIPLDPEQLLALDGVLERLAERDPRQASIVEMRFFGGFSTIEIAEALGVSDRTVKREWAFARAWLLWELEGGQP